MLEDTTTTEADAGAGTTPPSDPPAKPKAKAKTKAKANTKAKALTEKQTAVLQLVTISPAPRTTEELANQYAGLSDANLWPEQDVATVKSTIAALVSKKVLKEGEAAPDGEPTIEVA